VPTLQQVPAELQAEWTTLLNSILTVHARPLEARDPATQQRIDKLIPLLPKLLLAKPIRTKATKTEEANAVVESRAELKSVTQLLQRFRAG
jgi:hypothetical protein